MILPPCRRTCRRRPLRRCAKKEGATRSRPHGTGSGAYRRSFERCRRKCRLIAMGLRRFRRPRVDQEEIARHLIAIRSNKTGDSLRRGRRRECKWQPAALVSISFPTAALDAVMNRQAHWPNERLGLLDHNCAMHPLGFMPRDSAAKPVRSSSHGHKIQIE